MTYRRVFRWGTRLTVDTDSTVSIWGFRAFPGWYILDLGHIAVYWNRNPYKWRKRDDLI